MFDVYYKRGTMAKVRGESMFATKRGPDGVLGWFLDEDIGGPLLEIAGKVLIRGWDCLLSVAKDLCCVVEEIELLYNLPV